MNNKMIQTVKIGARRSDLARLQAYRVGQALESLAQVKVEYQFKESLGDKNLHDPLWKMPEKGVFTEDFTQDLVDGNVDLVVHSWKDLPTERDSRLEILATLPREDSRDLLFVKKARLDLAFSRDCLKIYSSSPRREHHLSTFLKWALPQAISKIEFSPVRGNMKTRIEKMLEHEVDGIIVAKAAMDRLLEASETEFSDSQKTIRQALRECRWMVLPIEENPAAAAQGALAVEALSSRRDLKVLLEKINCRKSYQDVEIERKLLAQYGGGCHQKLGMSCFTYPMGRYLRAKGVLQDGRKIDLREWQPLSSQNTVQNLLPSQKFPSTLKQMDWFDRSQVKDPTLPDPTRELAFFVAKNQALPDSWIEKLNGKVIWAAGLETWKKLSSRGVWVSGSSESWGEESPMLNVTQLVPSSTEWLKLTHVSSRAESKMKKLGTYVLSPQVEKVPDLSAFEAFYWPSYSHFRLALEKFGEILRSKRHFCGPGNTFQLISKDLGRAPEICLSFDDFHRSPPP